jgi:hypothetical protein
MTAWDERFSQHPVHQELANLLTEVRKLKLPTKAAGVEEARQRLDRALTHVQAVLKAADPELTVPAILDGVHGNIPPLRAQVESAENQEEPTYLNTANQYADAMLQSVAGITPRLMALDEVARLQEGATNFRQSVGQLVRHVRDEAEALEADIERQRAATAELVAEVEGQKGRVDQAISEHQAQFTAEQTEREQRFTESQDAHENGAKETVNNLAELEEKARRHLDVIGVVGMSAGYQQVADKEEKAANIWRLVAAGAAGLAIAFNLVLIVAIAKGWIKEEFAWDRQVPRVLLTLSLLALASYAGVESSHHRKRQEVNRQIEKELASLEPYMALFSDEEKKALKTEKFDLFFQGRTAQPITGGSEDVEPG